jgi:hypothetical protein
VTHFIISLGLPLHQRLDFFFREAVIDNIVEIVSLKLQILDIKLSSTSILEVQTTHACNSLV